MFTFLNDTAKNTPKQTNNLTTTKVTLFPETNIFQVL